MWCVRIDFEPVVCSVALRLCHLVPWFNMSMYCDQPVLPTAVRLSMLACKQTFHGVP
jgi:hypothetical protein